MTAKSSCSRDSYYGQQAYAWQAYAWQAYDVKNHAQCAKKSKREVCGSENQRTKVHKKNNQIQLELLLSNEKLTFIDALKS